MQLCSNYAILMHNFRRLQTTKFDYTFLREMVKEKRQKKIRSLIQTRQIGTQDELTEHLAKSGFAVTQSSVSRDLEQIGVIKSDGFYALPQTSQTSTIFGLQSLEAAGENLIVAKCELGLASAACVKIDAENIKEIVGTIAGEDTIFIAVKDAKAQKTTMKKIWELFGK